jgi:homospermidine synthase
MGMNTRVRTWVPNYTVEGMVVRHGEAFTISDPDGAGERQGGLPPDDALCLLPLRRGDQLAARAARPQLRAAAEAAHHERRDHGRRDILGALLMGHAFKSWWTGSDLSIGEARKLVPHQNATTLQVAISVVAAAMWMMENPERGVCSPDDLPHEFVLGVADPYLGKNLSVPSDWTPLKHYENHFEGYNEGGPRPEGSRGSSRTSWFKTRWAGGSRPQASIQNSGVRIQKVG